MPRINLADLAEQSFGTSLEQLDDRRIYKLLAKLVQERSAACPLNNGKKKLYYISAEFLIGKLLINNMIDLGIYDEVKDQLTAAGHDLNKIEEFEVEPSLGNGGLGRLAACFLDSIATLGLTGDGVGLNYHYGLFRQRFVDNQQKAVPDEWLGEQDILVDDDRSYTRLWPAHQEPPTPVRPGKCRRRPGPRQLHRLRQDRDRQEPHLVPLSG